MQKLLTTAQLRALQEKVRKGEITYSRMVEIINEKHQERVQELIPKIEVLNFPYKIK